MSLSHQCRCAICGEIGVITPGLPNVFTDLLNGVKTDTAPDGIERRVTHVAIVPEDTSPVGMVPFTEVPTCTHGYTRCMPCKFPS